MDDNLSDISKIARSASELGDAERVDVLPFHQLGQFKWKELKLEYKLKGHDPPTSETITRVCGQFSSAGLKVY